ncbi:MAG: cytochrome c biogenesis CcdA family protein [Candidatus Woesearchaeota archaeon]
MKIMFFLIMLIASAAVTALEFPPGAQKVLEYEKNIGLAVTFLIAFIGGLLTFTSPCGFVVIPTFFAYVFKERKRAMFMTAAFSLGMITAFIIFGIIAGIVGNYFNLYKEFFAILSGMLLIIFGIMLVLNKGFAFVDFKIRHQPQNGWGVFFLGFFFAVGWTPCVGPILAGIIILSATAGSIAKSVLLFAVYALGVTFPLLIVSYFSDKYDFSKWLTSKHVEFTIFGKKIYTHLYGIIGGIMLIVIGIIMMYYKGTRIFMTEIPKYVPWSMTFFTDMNEALVKSAFFTSTTANIIGIALVIILLIAIWRALRHKE